LDEAVSLAKKLVSYLDSNLASILQGVDPKEFFGKINQIEWLPVRKHPPGQDKNAAPIAWYANLPNSKKLTSPSKCSPRGRNEYLIGGVCPTLEVKVSQNLIAHFGWRHVELEKVVSNLISTIKAVKLMDQSRVRDSENRIQSALSKIYDFLVEYFVAAKGKWLTTADSKKAKEWLEHVGSEWVYLGLGIFASTPHIFSQSIQLDLSPFFHQLPESLLRYVPSTGSFLAQALASRSLAMVNSSQYYEVEVNVRQEI